MRLISLRIMQRWVVLLFIIVFGVASSVGDRIVARAAGAVTGFDICLQDETSRSFLLFNSSTGQYEFQRCGTDGFTLAGMGVTPSFPPLLQLKDIRPDRAVKAQVDPIKRSGRASVLYQGKTYLINDSDLRNNTCNCGAAATLALFTNPTDPQVLRAETLVGDVIEYFGNKDSSGLVTAITSTRVRDAGGRLTTALFDNQHRPVLIEAFNGLVFEIEWRSATSILVTAHSADGTITVSAPIDLNTQFTGQPMLPLSALPENQKISSSTSNKRLEPKGHISRSSPKVKLLTSQATAASASLVTVRQCGVPVNNALVLIEAVSSSGQLLLPGTLVGNGQYNVVIPTLGAGANVNALCQTAAQTIIESCELLNLITPPGAVLVICQALATTALLSPTTAPIAPDILSACLVVFPALKAYCSTIEQTQFFQQLCADIALIVNRALGEEARIRHRVRVPGGGVFDGNFVNVPASGPFPNFSIEFTQCTLNDDFNDNFLNPNLWFVLNPPAGTVAEVNQRLEITIGPGFQGTGIGSRYRLVGDFDVQMDFILLNWPSPNLHSVRLGVGELGVGPGGGIGLNRSSFPNSIVNANEFYLLALPDSKPQIATTHFSGTLRLIRTGATLSGYIRDGGNWVLVGSGTVPTTPTRLNLDLGGGSDMASGGIKAAIDNFKVNAGTVQF